MTTATSPNGTADDQGLDDVTRRIVEQTLVPSPNVTALATRKASGFVDRLRPSAAGLVADVAELFHVNSALVRHEPDQRFTAAEATAVRRWYFATCTSVREEDLAAAAGRVRLPHADLPPELAAVISPFGPQGPLTPLLYAVDLGVLLDRDGETLVCRQAPGTAYLWVERRLTEPDRQALRAAVPDQTAAALLGAHPTLVVVGVPWRQMLFEGPRGYRRTLMDAGVVVNALGATAIGHGLQPRPVFDFYDQELDELLGNDGVERSALALLVARRPEGDQP